MLIATGICHIFMLLSNQEMLAVHSTNQKQCYHPYTFTDATDWSILTIISEVLPWAGVFSTDVHMCVKLYWNGTS